VRLAREAKGLSLKQVADATKLSVRSIEALESGKFASLPEGIYRRSMVRAVAIEVGLQPDDLLKTFSIAHPDELQAREAVALAEMQAPKSSSMQAMLAIAGALVPILAGVVYFGFAFPRPAAPLRATRTTEGRRPEIVPAGGFAEAPPVDRRPVVMTLTLSSRCALRVVADGREVIGRTVEAGETLSVELGDEVLLSGDNAAAVQFSINGQAGRALGNAGESLSVRIGREDYEFFLVSH
jgi:transcriptional regulator with XRE-family HTH domain